MGSPLNEATSPSGYRGRALEALRNAGIGLGDLIRVERGDEVYEGFLMPRSELGDDQHVEIKLSAGYNIGIRLTPGVRLKKVGEGVKPKFISPAPPPSKQGLPRLSIISTGGTIASRVDYVTGAVRPALSATDLYAVVPELADLAIINAEVLFSLLSENLTPAHWEGIARKVAEHLNRGCDGVVVAHGTDTMAYTAAALSFALQNLPAPVILVGAQRSSDRPSSDAALNLIGASIGAIKAPFAEVALAMHESVSDAAIVLHRGVRVRKLHSSRRDAFKSVNASPLARVQNGKVTMLVKDYRPRDASRTLALKAKFSEKVTLLKFYPGFDPKMVEWLVDQGYKGLVLEGSGLGHVAERCFPSIREAVERGVVVAMTTQCIFGRTNLNVYETGRRLLALGVIPLADMLSEVAFVKLSWALGQTEEASEVKRLLTTNVAGEIAGRPAWLT